MLVDVVVTNQKGEAVANLHQQDFRIKEDGKPQTISAFDEHKRDASAPVTLPALPPNVYTNRRAINPADSVNVLLIDMLNTYPWFQKDVCNQAIKFLEALEPGTRLAIFTLNDQQLRLVRGFTTDFSGLSTALDGPQTGVIPEASWLNPTPSRHGAEMYGLRAMIMMQASPAAVEAVSQYLEQESDVRIAARSELTLQAFQHLARYLSGIPLRKNVIWFADSFPLSFGPDRKIHAPNHQLHVQQTSDLLTAAQVAIYPVSARGLLGDASFDIPVDTGQQLFQEFATSQINMEALARETGGHAFFNTNALNLAMTKAVDEGSRYYTLAYSPSHASNDGKYRRIDVKLASGDYKLSYRRGYYADQAPERSASEENGDPLIPLVGFGMPNFDQITYQVRALPVRPQPAADAPRAGLNTELKSPCTRYGIDLTVSLQNFTFATTPDGLHHGRIEAMLVAYDRDGKMVNIVRRNGKLILRPEEFLQLPPAALHLEIDVPPGDVYLRTGVYDVSSGSAGTLGFPLASDGGTTGLTK